MGKETQLNHILKTLRKISCDIGGTESNELLQQILEEIRDTPQLESLSPISYCDGNSLTGYVAYTLDEEDNSVTEIFFDSAGVVSNTRPLGIPCGKSTDYEFKFFEKQKCLQDGTNVLEILCIPFVDGVEQTSSTFWVINGLKILIEPLGIEECQDCQEKGSQGTILDWNILK